MTGRSVNYTCTLVHGTGKIGKLKTDEKGYSECTLGAFNVYNGSGQYYPLLDSVKEMFAEGGSLRRRLDRGLCRGELDHPSPQPGQPVMDFIKRVLSIQSDRVSHHIASVRLDEARDDKGNLIVLATGRVKPSGPYANVLEQSLNNTEENVAFSIRSLADEKNINSRTEKHVTMIVTWDYVNEPGIAVANKYQTPTMESLGNNILITEDMLNRIASDRIEGVTLESATNATMVLTELGWQKVQVINPKHSYLNW